MQRYPHGTDLPGSRGSIASGTDRAGDRSRNDAPDRRNSSTHYVCRRSQPEIFRAPASPQSRLASRYCLAHLSTPGTPFGVPASRSVPGEGRSSTVDGTNRLRFWRSGRSRSRERTTKNALPSLCTYRFYLSGDRRRARVAGDAHRGVLLPLNCNIRNSNLAERQGPVWYVARIRLYGHPRFASRDQCGGDYFFVPE